ncbi:hypothetical protein [Streptomyces javensis]|uniref:Uncharacterized protein n=1 Tax=Streptomyces javensis TaxID=114698 RepID=A0ABP4I0K4_9ACTN
MTAFLKDCRALGHELLPENGEGTRARLKRLVKVSVRTEADTGNFARKQERHRDQHPCCKQHSETDVNARAALSEAERQTAFPGWLDRCNYIVHGRRG